MECVFCKGKTKVIDVRTHSENGNRCRRRECIECGERFSTYEVSQLQMLEKLDQHLPMMLVDKISQALAISFPEREDAPADLFDFYFTDEK